MTEEQQQPPPEGRSKLLSRRPTTVLIPNWNDQPRVKPPTILETLFKQKNVKRSVYYFTTGRKVDKDNIRNVETEPTPFWYPPDTDQLCYRVVDKSWRKDARNKERAFDYTKRPTYSSRQRQDLLERLYLSEEKIDKLAFPGILDIDPDFYKVIEGRPERAERFDIRKYINDIRKIVKVKLKTGYNEDEIYQIEEQFIEEQKRIDEIKTMYKIYVDGFERFLAEDHEDSMRLLKEASDCANVSANMETEYKRLLRVQSALRCRIYVLEDKWRDSKVYQKFLYKVSPLEWRRKHDHINKVRGSFDSVMSDASTESTASMEKEGERAVQTDQTRSLESLIETFNKEIALEEPPVLYFTDPKELLNIFDTIERANLDAMLHMDFLTQKLEGMTIQFTETKIKLTARLEESKKKVEETTAVIVKAEERANSLEEAAHSMLNGLLRESVVGDDVLSLYVFVEDAYEAAVATNDNKLEVSVMMSAIEEKYIDLIKEMEDLPRSIVRQVEKEIYAAEATKMLKAKQAVEKLRELDLVMVKLRRGLAPPPKNKKKPLMFRSAPPERKKKIKKPVPITNEERAYVKYFTNFCGTDDQLREYLKTIEVPTGASYLKKYR